MTVTAHVMPHAEYLLNSKQINLVVTTSSPVIICGLSATGPGATWTATQEAYQFVSDWTGAYPEVSGGGYARTSALVTCTVTPTGAPGSNKVIWTCTSPAPISFGASVSFAATSMFIYTTQIGSADSSYPLLSVIDFGTAVTSTAGPWTYTVDAVNGLAYWTES